MYRLQKIDELLLPSYKYLTAEDECYFFMGYTPVWAGHTAENGIIMNFKKAMDRKGKNEWKWKEREIRSISNLFIQNIPSIIAPQSIIVPVPPSKVKGDPLYDDRLIQLAENYCAVHPQTEFREIVSLPSNMIPTHIEEKDSEELAQLLTIDDSLCLGQKSQIVIMDDVLRHGAHFKAIKTLLQPKFPNSDIIGLFIARTIH